MQEREELKKICDATGSTLSVNYSLQLLVEDSDQAQRVWQLNWREAQLNYVATSPAISFKTLLEHMPPPPLIIRRKLALMFAYSLFQLHESPWLSQQWDKDHIYFFYTPTGPDLQRPYLSASFHQLPSGGEPRPRELFHRNLGILKLGVLLIEVEKWKPLESFRTEDDLKDGDPTPNSVLVVARRVQRTLNDCFYTYSNAIDACLKVDWIDAGSRVSLEDQATRNGVYAHIIQPLESDVAYGDMVFSYLAVYFKHSFRLASQSSYTMFI